MAGTKSPAGKGQKTTSYVREDQLDAGSTGKQHKRLTSSSFVTRGTLGKERSLEEAEKNVAKSRALIGMQRSPPR